jgi:Glycosyl transferases group 1
MSYERLKQSKRSFEYAYHYNKNLLRQRLRGAADRTIHFLQISSAKRTTSEIQFDPIWINSALLCERLGVVVRHVGIDESLRLSAPALARFDAVGFQFLFRTPTEEVLRFVDTLRSRCSPRTKLVYFDGDDDLGILWPQILKKTDLYVKSQVMRDRTCYLRSTIGKSNLTDYVATHFGTSFDSNEIPRSAPVTDEADLGRIFLGWNLGTSKLIFKLAKEVGPNPPFRKDLDVCCRVPFSPNSWIAPLRLGAIRELKRLTGESRVVATTDRIPVAQFHEELKRSRICVSPPGHGEICFRDFEAVLRGCLLVKPDMSHLESRPDIYVAGETYIPVRWDFADLVEKCQFYLDNEGERVRIANQAFRTLRDFHDKHAFIHIFADLLDQLGLRSADGARSDPA